MGWLHRIREKRRSDVEATRQTVVPDETSVIADSEAAMMEVEVVAAAVVGATVVARHRLFWTR